MTKRFLLSLVILGTSALLWGAERAPLGLPDNQVDHRVHSAIVADESLPYCAHLVNVRSESGKVTLRGHVKTAEQKEKVGQRAADVVGKQNVINDVTLSGS